MIIILKSMSVKNPWKCLLVVRESCESLALEQKIMYRRQSPEFQFYSESKDGKVLTTLTTHLG